MRGEMLACATIVCKSKKKWYCINFTYKTFKYFSVRTSLSRQVLATLKPDYSH